MVNPQHEALIRFANVELGYMLTENEKPRYTIDPEEGFISSGSFGKVYMGYDHANSGRRVAIKIGDHRNPMLQRLFQRETEIFRKHPHENIIEIYDHHVSATGKPVLVMEYLPFSLANKLAEEKLSLEKTIGYIEPACKAVDHLHEKDIIHRNIKPSNILIGEDGTVKLSDLGQAGFSGTVSTVKGTQSYRAPEGFPAHGRFYPESDIYSIAVITFEALTGTRPFRGEPDKLEQRESLEHTKGQCREAGFSDELTRVLTKGMHPDHTKRYHSGREYVEALKGLKEK